MRPVNLHMTSGAVGVLRVLVMLWSTRFNGSDVMRDAVASETQLIDSAEPQQPRIGRAVRCMTRRASFGLQRRMFVGKWPLLIGVTLDAGGVGASGQPGLL
jgi:hypothetical protein